MGIFAEHNDAGGQLAWLRGELEQAEKQEKLVWIVGHVPIGFKDCNPKWALRYTVLLERFQHIIRFQTFGHVHTEEFDVSRSLTSNKPIGVEFIAGNSGTYDAMDPTVRLYTMHKTHHVPLEFSVYRQDIEKANEQAKLGKEPPMDLYTDFKRDFELANLSPSVHADLALEILTVPDVANHYKTFRHKRLVEDWTDPVCDKACQRFQYCTTSTTVQVHKELCLGEDTVNSKYHFEYTVVAKGNPWVRANPGFVRPEQQDPSEMDFSDLAARLEQLDPAPTFSLGSIIQ